MQRKVRLKDQSDIKKNLLREKKEAHNKNANFSLSKEEKNLRGKNQPETLELETLKLIRRQSDFEIFTGKIENYNSIKFTNSGAVERT